MDKKTIAWIISAVVIIVIMTLIPGIPPPP